MYVFSQLWLNMTENIEIESFLKLEKRGRGGGRNDEF